MSLKSINKISWGAVAGAACVMLCVAIVAQAQYNSYNSDSNSDSDGSPILTQSELGRLVRNSARAQAQQNQLRHNQHQVGAASKNMYNRQQSMQIAPTQHRRNYGPAEPLNGFGPSSSAASNHRGLSSEGRAGSGDDDDEGSSYGPNFDGDGDGESSNANSDGPVTNLNQAASGYPGQGDYNNDNMGFNFGAAGYGPSLRENSEFGAADAYLGDGRRAKSASSPMGARGYENDDDSGAGAAPLYGPNSAVNAGDNEDDGRSGYAPEGDNDNDDE